VADEIARQQNRPIFMTRERFRPMSADKVGRQKLADFIVRLTSALRCSHWLVVAVLVRLDLTLDSCSELEMYFYVDYLIR